MLPEIRFGVVIPQGWSVLTFFET